MAIKPILFNTDMVRAILENQKTTTRRAVKGADALWGFDGMENDPSLIGIDKDGEEYPIDMQGLYAVFETQIDEFPTIRAPYQPGDILYVRETWERLECCCCEGDSQGKCFNSRIDSDGCYVYKASHTITGDAKWHPSIHMPKLAARIFLRVTGVRVERLQDISREDTVAEGVPCRARLHGGYCGNGGLCDCPEYKREFAELWGSTVKPTDRTIYGWAANPWVWVIEFERCEKPEGWP